MSRSYPTNERGMWRMYCDSCNHVDPDRFPRNECPTLEHYAAKGWLIGKINDRCPKCRTRTDLPRLAPHITTIAELTVRAHDYQRKEQESWPHVAHAPDAEKK